MAGNNPASRYDTNSRLKAEYRTPYVVQLVERARRCGVPEQALAYDGDGDNWYTELVLQASLLARGEDPEHLTGWARVRQLEDLEDMLRLGLQQYCGLQESAETGQLVPRFAKLHNLIMRQADNARG